MNPPPVHIIGIRCQAVDMVASKGPNQFPTARSNVLRRTIASSALLFKEKLKSILTTEQNVNSDAHCSSSNDGSP